MNLPKNSFIYDFFLGASIEEIDKINDVSENTLWYGLKSLRMLLAAITPYTNTHQNLVLRNAFNVCLEQVTECFFRVTN